MQELNIERINELARKKKTVGLTPAEAAEQQELRQAYIAAIRKSLREVLSQVDILEKDGTVTHMEDVIRAKEEKQS